MASHHAAAWCSHLASGLGDESRSDVPARTGLCLDDDLLAEALRHFVGDDPRDHVSIATGGKTVD